MTKYLLSLSLFLSFHLWSSAQNTCSDQPIGNLISDITPTQAHDTINAYLDKDWFVILDIRTPTEYNSMHLEEGVLLNFYSGIFSTEVAKFDRNKVYILHCATGARSVQAKVVMQNLGFYRVYNMTGGINSWNNSGYPTTTHVASIASTCVNEYSFEDVIVGNTESFTFKITNAANDLLTISNISGLDGTEFSTDFDIDTTLFGSFDYEFNVYYTPVDIIADNQVFTVTTSGGTIEFYLTGTSTDYTSITEGHKAPINVYNNSQNKQIEVLANSNDLIAYNLVSISGVVHKSGIIKGQAQICYHDILSGIYILTLNSDKETKNVKLMLY